MTDQPDTQSPPVDDALDREAAEVEARCLERVTSHSHGAVFRDAASMLHDLRVAVSSLPKDWRERRDAQRDQDAEDAWLIATRCEVTRNVSCNGDSRYCIVMHRVLGIRPDGLPILTDEIRDALRKAKPWT